MDNEDGYSLDGENFDLQKSVMCKCQVSLRDLDLVQFVQFEKREKHPWRRVTFSKVVALKF